METLPLFSAHSESLMKQNGRTETLWFETGLRMTLDHLRDLETMEHADQDKHHEEDSIRAHRLNELKLLLLAWVLGNNGLDSRASVAWRKVGEIDYQLDYREDLARIESEVASALIMMTGHVKSRARRMSLSKGLKIGAATILGGGVLAASGAVAAPIIGAALASSAATASAGAFLSSAVGIGAVAGVFGVYGANRTAWKMAKRVGGLKEFFFLPVVPKRPDSDDTTSREDDRSDGNVPQQQLHCFLGISGWIQKEEAENMGGYWSQAFASVPSADRSVLVFDRKVLEEYGNALRKFVIDQGLQSVVLHAAVFAGGHAVMAAATPPAIALMLQDVVDSPFAVAMQRAKLAGEELARALHTRALGNRPISLVGFGFGSTAILTCLEKLAEEKGNAEGLIQDVVLFGSPIRMSPDRWQKTVRIVAGRYVNCYCPRDLVLVFLLRLSTKRFPAAGVQPLGIPGIEDRQVNSTAYEIGTIPGLIDFYLKDILLGSGGAQQPSIGPPSSE